MKIITFSILAIALILTVETRAEFYTVTQSFYVPGKDCQLIWIGIYNDQGTRDKSDDRLLKYDVFIRCNNPINQPDKNTNEPLEKHTVAITPGNCAAYISALTRGGYKSHKAEVDYLVKIAHEIDKGFTDESVTSFFNLIENAPESFKPFIEKAEVTH